jgi:hypothetical protein
MDVKPEPEQGKDPESNKKHNGDGTHSSAKKELEALKSMLEIKPDHKGSKKTSNRQ